jgi:hypothetical protein
MGINGEVPQVSPAVIRVRPLAGRLDIAHARNQADHRKDYLF